MNQTNQNQNHSRQGGSKTNDRKSPMKDTSFSSSGSDNETLMETENQICEHEWVYENVILTSYPPQQNKICKKCGQIGRNTIGKLSQDDYKDILKKFTPKNQTHPTESIIQNKDKDELVSKPNKYSGGSDKLKTDDTNNHKPSDESRALEKDDAVSRIDDGSPKGVKRQNRELENSPQMRGLSKHDEDNFVGANPTSATKPIFDVSDIEQKIEKLKIQIDDNTRERINCRMTDNNYGALLFEFNELAGKMKVLRAELKGFQAGQNFFAQKVKDVLDDAKATDKSFEIYDWFVERNKVIEELKQKLGIK